MAKIIPLAQTITGGCETKPYVHPEQIVKDVSPADLRGARVLFINMPLRESARPVNTPEGPLLMATRLRDHFEVDVSIIDLNGPVDQYGNRIKDKLWEERVAQGENLPWGRHPTFQEAKDHIQRHVTVYGRPHLIGLSGKITTFKWQRELARFIKQTLPEVFLVSGGGLATELRQHLFNLNYIPELDGVSHSEGDDVVIKIVYDALAIHRIGFKNALNTGKLAPYYIGEINGRRRFVYAGDRPRNLDLLPFGDLELLRTDVFGRKVLEGYLTVPIWSRQANNSSAIPWDDKDVAPKTSSVSSRGCPFGCKYCFRGSQGERKWGVRSAEHIMTELQHHIEHYGIKFHGFPDDNFAVTLDRIRLINNIVSWGTHTRLDEVAGLNATTRGTAETMAKAGCKYIGSGPESASPKVLEAIGKGGHTLSNGMEEVMVAGEKHAFPRSMVVGIRNALENGIHSNCTWILACPTETLEDLKTTVRFMLWQQEYYSNMGHPIDSVNTRMFTLTWYPGTTIINYERVRRELTRVFGITFQPAGTNTSGVEWEPVYDDKFLKYMLELDDATKVLHGENDEPLNFGDMPTDHFLQTRAYIDSGQTLKILDMR